MKKISLFAMFALICNFAMAQIEQTSYKGAFAPAPTAMWTDSWTNFDPQNTVYPTATVTISAPITANTTWTAGNTYELGGIIYVKNNATLTIEPGVIVRAGGGNGASLVVTKGAKVEANGTAANPIVFTSINAPGSRNKGDWGGIILLGRGAFNINIGVSNIEGITATADTEFGGGANPDNADNSGTLRYVRIEFGGYVYAPNAEINGLTMGAVGSGTTIDYVQTSFINDDAFEWFGGAVNCTHLVSYRNLDDDFDTDNGFSGNVQFCLAIRDPKISDAPLISTSEGFESDNNATGSTATPYTSATFSNCTLIGPSYRKLQSNGGPLATGFKRSARIRRASQLKIYNSLFLDFEEGLHIDGVKAEDNAVAGTLIFSNNIQAGILTKSIQVTSPGTTTTGNNSSFNMTTWYATNGNTTLASSTGLLTRAYGTTGTDYANLDYRPASAAPVVTSPVSYCKGAVATALTATLSTTAVSLKWYTAATGGTALASAPVPSTTATTSYFVSQVYPTGVESGRSEIVVNVVSAATPGSISGTASQESIIGTTTAATYSVAAVDGAASYVWTVPTGVTIVSGQGTNTLTVNFKDYVGGRGSIGTLSVLAVNAAGCTSAAAATLELTNAPLQAPTIVTPVNLCKASTATALTATLNNSAVSLKWYTAAGVAIANAPVPTTTTAGTVSYKVSQVYANGEEGPQATIAVTVNNALTALAGAITGTAAQGTLVKTETTAEYSIAAVTGADRYVWTVPTGMNIVSGQGTLKVVVNFKDVAEGASPIGNISVQAVNAAGCGGAAKTLALTKALLVAPATIKMTDELVSSATAVTSFAKYIGTDRVLTVTAAPVVNATSYDWELPLGITIVTGERTGSSSNVITIKFKNVTSADYHTYTANGVSTNVLRIGVKARNGVGASITPNTALVNPGTLSTAKLLTLTATAPAAPAAIKMTNDAISTSTAVTIATPFIGTETELTLTATASLLASSYTWELPAGVSQVAGGTTNVIKVKFKNVEAGVTTFYIGVKAVNGINSSSTANVSPFPNTTFKYLRLGAALPAAPAAVKMTDDAISTSTAVTVVTKYIGTETLLKLTATASATATSYTWELPTGVNVMSGGASLSTNIIIVNLKDVVPGTFSLTFGAKAVNAVGSSVTSNSTVIPTTTSTAKLLKVNAVLPAIVGAVTGELKICATKATSATYTITAVPAGALKYNITVPTDCTINTTGSTKATINATAGATFTVNYPSGFTANTSTYVKKIIIESENGVGVNLAASKFIQLTNTGAICPTNIRIAPTRALLTVSATEVYPNPVSSDFNIDVTVAQAGTLEIAIYSLDGTIVVNPKTVQLQEGVNTINENVSSLNKGIYIVQLVNSSNGEVITKKLVKN